jgi:hypothetical protein
MPKITFIGAGSFGFTRTLVRDLLTFPLLEGATICLMDISADRLESSRRAVQRIVDEGKYPATVVTTLDRVEALKGADYVIVTILAGCDRGLAARHRDPKKYGVDMNVGDTRGPSRHLPRAAHDPGDDGDRPRHGALLPARADAQLHQPDGDALPRDCPRDEHHRDRASVTACRVRRRCWPKWIGAPMAEIRPTPAPASTTWPGISNTSGRAKTPTR